MRCLIQLTSGVLEVLPVVAAVASPEAGATDIFVGTTRNHAEGKEVARLEYEAYEPMARHLMQQLVDDAGRRWPLCGAAIVHRTGVVPVGEASVIIAVSAPHRSETFEACRFLIDRLKEDVPVWKREHFADGSSEWSRSPKQHSPVTA